MKIQDTPLFLLLSFTLIYAVMGNPDSNIWSGSYFIVNYITMFWLFTKERSKLNRIIGMSLSFSILVFIIIKYIFGIQCERYYTFIPFILAVFSIYKLETK